MLVSDAEIAGCVRCFQAGADGLFLTPGTRELFEETVHSALNGWKPVPREVQKLLIERFICTSLFSEAAQALTRREREVMGYLAMACLDKEIAASTGKTIATVRTQTNNIYKKLNVHRRGDAVSCYLGLVCRHEPQNHRRDCNT